MPRPDAKLSRRQPDRRRSLEELRMPGRPMPKERAVFAPSSSGASTAVEASEVDPTPASAVVEMTGELLDERPALYRVPLLYLGRDELIAVLPEREMEIRLLNPCDIEALADQLEAALAPLYPLVLRMVLQAHLNTRQRPR